MIPVPEIGLARAIEVADRQGWYEPDGSLVVWDSLTCPSGTRLEIQPSKPGWFRAAMRDRAQRGCSCTVNGTREDAARACLSYYLDVCTQGI